MGRGSTEELVEHGLGFSRPIPKYWLDINLLNYSEQLGGYIIPVDVNVHISAT